jgi:multicomponent Na+:H+ antiporter subunit F
MTILFVCLMIAAAFFSIAGILVFLAVAKGPALEDRVVAVDLFSSLLLSSIAWYAIFYHEASYLDGGLVLALFAFVGTLVFARFIEKEARGKETP